GVPVGRLPHPARCSRGCLDTARRFLFGHELVDLDGSVALNGDGLKLFRLYLNVFTFADFVALHDVGWIHFLAVLRIYLAVSDTIAGLFVDLIKADLLSLAARGK